MINAGDIMTYIYFYDFSEKSSPYNRNIMYKLNHAVAYGMIGHILSKFYNISTDKIRLTKQQSGKPVLLYPDITLNISISHSDTIVASALSYNVIGIDIEKVVPVKTNIWKYNDFFSDVELAEIAESDCITECFAAMWTRKEAYLKRRGVGIECIKKSPCFHNSIQTIMLDSLCGEKFAFSYSTDEELVRMYRYNSDAIGKLLDIYNLIARSTII